MSEGDHDFWRTPDPSKCVNRRHVLRRIIEGRCASTFVVASWRPALICKTMEPVVTENEMVEQPDTQEVSSVPQTCGQCSILRARRGISEGTVGGECYSPDNLRNDHVDAFLKCRGLRIRKSLLRLSIAIVDMTV